MFKGEHCFILSLFTEVPHVVSTLLPEPDVCLTEKTNRTLRKSAVSLYE